MTWLFSKALCESLHCSPGREAEFLEGNCSDGEPFAPLNVMPTPQPFWRNDKTMDVLSRSPFGLTWEPLMENHGEELLTLFRAGFLARTSALPEKARASKESEAASGEKWRASFTKYDPDSSSWKTHQLSILGEWGEYSETWPKWGLMRNGECWERQTLERRTDESGSGFMPTPTTQDNNQVRGNGAAEMHGKRGTTLGGYVRMWPTPQAHDAQKGNADRVGRYGTKHGARNLNDWAAMWPTPAARDYRSPNKQSYRERGGGTKGEQLPNAVGGQLNPTWVEWLMGFPCGWTELRPLGMHKYREWLQQHSLCYPNDQSELEGVA